MEKDNIDADEFYEIVASNPETMQDFVGLPNTQETREKLYAFIKKKWREEMTSLANCQPMSAEAGSILTYSKHSRSIVLRSK